VKRCIVYLCIQPVQFEVGDVTKRDFPAKSFDAIFSRDTILHIKDKQKLFSKFYVSVVYRLLLSRFDYFQFLFTIHVLWLGHQTREVLCSAPGQCVKNF